MPSPELTELLDLVRGGRVAMAGRVVGIDEHRARYRKLGALLPMPDGVTIEQVELGGVPAERLVPAGADDGAAVVYLHGGGYCIGGPDTHRSMCAHLAAALGCPVLVLDYRLAPEHPHPAAVDDAVAAVRAVLAGGIAPARLAIAGDSAGGGLTAVTAMARRDAGDPMPAATVLISPWTDLAGGSPSYESRAAVDPFVFPESLTEMADWYLAGHDPRDPRVSPFLGDLAGLPLTLIHVGDHECLLDDAAVMGERLAAAGVDATVEVWPEMVHVWHFFAGRLPEADDAIAGIARWLRPRLGLGA
ncbi:MAG TPA: alpha/beta hydrolase [Acidimicrobiales bacterium]|nr:alpha/beta hydrolase [Acidimicrobiales bacterium]